MVKECPEQGARTDGKADRKCEKVRESQLHGIAGESPDKGGEKAENANRGEQNGERTKVLQAKFFSGGQG